MCHLCEHPEMSLDDYLDRVRSELCLSPFVVQSVGGGAELPEFSYTVGLTARRRPELVVLGRRPGEAAHLLRIWGDYVLRGNVVRAGETLSTGPFLLEAVEVEEAALLAIARALYGEQVRALQLVWADGRGRWPWEPGHRARRAGQPLLGPRSPVHCDEHRDCP